MVVLGDSHISSATSLRGGRCGSGVTTSFSVVWVRCSKRHVAVTEGIAKERRR